MSDEDVVEAAAEATATDEELDADDGEGLGGRWPVDRLAPLLEALLFASGDPLSVKKVCEVVDGVTSAEVRATLKSLAEDYCRRGLRVVEVGGGWQLRTGPEHHRYVRRLFRRRPFRLTRASTETLAICAYNQPVTRQDVEAIRGVDSGAILENLVEKRLLKIVGRKDVPGRPLLYATTGEFLELFGLPTLRDLPTLAELGDDVSVMADETGFRDYSSPAQADLPLGGDAGDDEAGQGAPEPAESGQRDEDDGEGPRTEPQA